MKQYGKIVEGKDITNKTYVDEKDLDLDERKLEESDFDELSNSRVLELWNQYIGEGGEEGSGSSSSSLVELSTDIESDKTSDSKAVTPKAVYTYVQSVAFTSGITSSTIASIWAGSQSEYDSLSEISNTTLYFIKG